MHRRVSSQMKWLPVVGWSGVGNLLLLCIEHSAQQTAITEKRIIMQQTLAFILINLICYYNASLIPFVRLITVRSSRELRVKREFQDRNRSYSLNAVWPLTASVGVTPLGHEVASRFCPLRIYTPDVRVYFVYKLGGRTEFLVEKWRSGGLEQCYGCTFKSSEKFDPFQMLIPSDLHIGRAFESL